MGHTDKYTFYPKDKVIEEIIQGPISGGWVLSLHETPEGTRIDWNFDMKAESLKFRIIGALRGGAIMQGIADEYCRQLSEYAEAQGTKRSQKESILA